jgi:hypothetical protein
MGTDFRVVALEFSEPVDAAVFAQGAVRIVAADGTVFQPVDIAMRDRGRQVVLTYDPLGQGAYELRLDAAAITDKAGNALGGEEITIAFTVSNKWIQLGGGSWHDPGNWSTGKVPEPGDDVVIDLPPDALVEYSEGMTTIRSLRTSSSFVLSRGTLTLSADSVVGGSFLMTGGTLGGSGELRLSGTGNRWEGGTLTGGGAIRIDPNADLTLSSGGYSPLVLADRNLINAGTLVADGGNVDCYGDVLIDNSGTFELRGEGGVSFQLSGGHATLNNTGLLLVGAHFATLEFTLNNDGVVELVGSSELILRGDELGKSTGSFIVPPEATLELELKGGQRFEGTAALTGGGRVILSGGNLTLASTASHDVTLSVDGFSTLTVEGTTVLSRLELLNGVVTGAGTLILSGSGSVWVGGTMTGGGVTRVASGADLTIGSWYDGSVRLGDRTLANEGTLNISQQSYSSITFELEGAAVLDNSGSIRIVALSDGGILDSGGDPGSLTLNNSGSIVLELAGSRYRLDNTTLNNTGTLKVQDGALAFVGSGSGTSTGMLDLPEGARIEFAGGQRRFEATAGATGGGVIELSAGTLILEGGTYDVILALSDGNLVVDGPVTARFLDMTGGTLSGAGTLTLTAPASELLGGTVSVPIVELVPDIVPPSVVETSIPDGAIYTLPNGEVGGRDMDPILIVFSEPMRPDSLVAGNVYLLSQSGTRIDSVALAIGPRFKSVTLTVPRLLADTYRLVVAGQNLEDHRAGNPIADGEVTLSTFHIV